MDKKTSDIKSIKDFIYFDFDKAASIFSQITDGLTTSTQTEQESVGVKNARLGLSVLGISPEVGGEKSNRSKSIESKILHHNLFSLIENFLLQNNLVFHLKIDDQCVKPTNDQIHKDLAQKFYLNATGKVTFEDYKLMDTFCLNFNKIADFINISNATQTPLASELTPLLKRKEELESFPPKNIGQAKIEANKTQKLIDEIIIKIGGVSKFPAWLEAGLRDTIDLYMKDRFILKVQPSKGWPELQVIASLKRECFTDSDTSNLLFSYGGTTQIKLTILGLITSAMDPEGTSYLDAEEQKERAEKTNLNHDNPSTHEEKIATFQESFTNAFKSIEKLQGFFNYLNYPKIVVYPLAVYREIFY